MLRIKIDDDLNATVDKEVDPLDPGKGHMRVHHRTNAEYDAVSKALQYGNRRERRTGFRFKGGRDGDGGAVQLTTTERNRRNAARRVAKKSRKRNGGRR